MDNAKFCSNSRGSCGEMLDHLITVHDEELIQTDMLSKGRDLVNIAVKLINGYMNSLKKAAKGPSAEEPPATYITADNTSPITDNQ